MAALHIPALRECIQRLDAKAATQIFEPLQDSEKIELLKAVFVNPNQAVDIVPIMNAYEVLIWAKLIHSRVNENIAQDKFFEKFVLATRLIEPNSFINLLLKNLMQLDSSAVGRFLEERESFKSAILSYGLDFFLDAGLSPSQTTDSTNPNLSFISFFEVCEEKDATTNGVLFPSPSNIENLSSSPHLMEYLEVFSSKEILHRLMANQSTTC